MKADAVLKTAVEVSRIRMAGRIIGGLFAELAVLIVPGISTRDIEDFCRNRIEQNKAVSAVKGYNNYPGHVCISVNQVMAHGIPNEYEVKNGDLVKVDIAVQLGGWHADGAWTYLAGRGSEESVRLRNTAWAASLAGVEAAQAGYKVGDIGNAIHREVIRQGCFVIPNFVGHGIGKVLHEEPSIYPVGTKDTGHPIVPGMVFTVEPLVTLIREDVKTLQDGWTTVAVHGSKSAQFEHTVAVFSTCTEILTVERGMLPFDPEKPPF